MNDTPTSVSAPADHYPGRFRRLLWLSLGLILFGGVGAHLIKTNGGSVIVTGFRLPTENGQWVAADLFRPVTATEKKPAPLVVVCPGFERSKETMDPYAIELARRGFVVITIDPYNQGASSGTLQRRSTTVEGNGVIPMIDYVIGTPNLNYVDRTRIGVAGYSAGGNAALQTAARFGERQARALRRAAAATSDGGKTVTDAEQSQARAANPVSAIFVGGYVLTMTDDVLAPIQANVGVDYARWDEGAFRNDLKHARLESARESLRLVNTIFPDNKLTAVEIGKHYGDPRARTLRVVHNTRNIHPLLPYDPRHIAHLTGFFATAFNLDYGLGRYNQLWPVKELCTLLALLGGFLFLVPFAALLLRLPVFAGVAQPVPPAPPAPDRTGRIIYWITFAVSALVACFLFVPMAQATLVLFPDASNRVLTWFFPQRINNAILLWAVANGLFGLAVFFVTHWLRGRNNGRGAALAALKLSGRDLLRTLLLAIAVVGGFYVLLFASYGLFHTDFRFTFVSAAASFPRKMLLVALEYVPLFFVFFLANSIRVNCASRFDGAKEWVNRLINGLGNSVGLMLILAIQYAWLAITGTVHWTDEWLYVNLLLGVLPMMFVLPYFNRVFFLLTGRVYLGPMVTCLLFILMMLTSNVCYIPLR